MKILFKKKIFGPYIFFVFSTLFIKFCENKLGRNIFSTLKKFQTKMSTHKFCIKTIKEINVNFKQFIYLNIEPLRSISPTTEQTKISTFLLWTCVHIWPFGGKRLNPNVVTLFLFVTASNIQHPICTLEHLFVRIAQSKNGWRPPPESDALLLSKRWPVCRRSRSCSVVVVSTKRIPVFSFNLCVESRKHYQDFSRAFVKILERIYVFVFWIFMVILDAYLIDLRVGSLWFSNCRIRWKFS